jgi:hypothetical protein
MSFSLYDALVPNFRQTVGAVRALIGKVEAFCAEQGLAPDDIIDARLAEDMLPFAYQVKSVAVHSAGAIEGVRRGQFSPDSSAPPASFAALAARMDETAAALDAVSPDEVHAFIGGDMAFVAGERRIPFAAEDFLLSFSLPNFYFHATTAYDILRWKGLPLSKRDYLGGLRIKALT